VMHIMDQAEGVLRDLFETYSSRTDELPAERRDLSGDAGARARQIANFIAGMTDRYALIEHARIFDSTPELR
jgi:dGTPase